VKPDENLQQLETFDMCIRCRLGILDQICNCKLARCAQQSCYGQGPAISMSFIFVVFKSTNKLAVSLLLTVAAASKDKKMAFCCLDCAAEFDASKNCRKRIVAGQHCSDA